MIEEFERQRVAKLMIEWFSDDAETTCAHIANARYAAGDAAFAEWWHWIAETIHELRRCGVMGEP